MGWAALPLRVFCTAAKRKSAVKHGLPSFTAKGEKGLTNHSDHSVIWNNSRRDIMERLNTMADIQIHKTMA